jgi:hypothetical protein
MAGHNRVADWYILTFLALCGRKDNLFEHKARKNEEE